MLTQEDLIAILSNPKKINFQTDYHEEVREIYEALENHFDDDYPRRLLESTRPNEEEWMKLERERVWECPSRVPIKRVENLLTKIRQADDFRINWLENEIQTGIAQENSFRDYCEKKLPVYGSLEDWLFQTFQRYYLSDPNALIWVAPKVDDIREGFNLDKPFPQLIESEDIVELGESYAVWKIEEDKKKRIKYFGACDETTFYYVTYEQGQTDKISIEVYPIFSSYPIHTVGSVVYEVEDYTVIYESIVQAAIPEWNQALRRADDNNILWIKQAYPKEWEYKSTACKTCKGSGRGKGAETTCKTCNGSGNDVVESPFQKIVISIPKTNALTNENQLTAIPTPPAGIIERDLATIKEFGIEIQARLYNGMRALGLEYLFESPLAVSGEAKIQDKKEVHTFLYQVAVHYVTIYQWVAKNLYLQKYAVLPNLVTEERMNQNLPKLTIPTDFDIYTAAEIADALAMARDKSFGPEISNGLERDLLIKQYGEGSMAVKKNEIRQRLNPLPNYKPDEIALLKESGMVSNVDAMLAVKIDYFTNVLTAEDDSWWSKTYTEKRQDLERLAQDELEKISQRQISRVTFEA